MAELTVQFANGKKRSVKLQRLTSKMSAQLKSGLKRGGFLLEGDIKKKLSGPSHVRNPGNSNPFPGVDTNRLRSSIAAKYEASGPRERIGTAVHYAPYLEFGTRNMKAYAFMKPSFDENIEKVIDTVFKEVMAPAR